MGKLSSLNGTHPTPIQYECFSDLFTMEELNYSLKLKRNSVPGIDGIDYTTLSHLPPSARIIFLDLTNRLLRWGDPPQTMKTSIIIPILKKGLPINVATSYRPITISPCITKVVERMIKERIERHVEERIGVRS